VSYNAQKLVRQLPREITSLKLTPNSWRLLDFLAHCANEEDALKQGGQYFAFPGEDVILRDLNFSSATLYRAYEQLEYTCGFYLITRRDCKDRRKVLCDLHIHPRDFKPEALQEREQAAAARLSLARGNKGARKRNTSQNERYLPEITSQNERYSAEIPHPKCEVITSQFAEKTPEITSQNETQNKEVICTNRENKPGRGENAAAPPPTPSRKPGSKTSGLQNAETRILEAHAEMWTALVDELTRRIPLPAKFEKANNAESYRLLNQAFVHVGGAVRFRGFEQRPRDASFARKEFLEYLRNNDPAYEAAVAEAITVSLDVSPPGRPRVKSSRSP
jgi:hypothetical protein